MAEYSTIYENMSSTFFDFNDKKKDFLENNENKIYLLDANIIIGIREYYEDKENFKVKYKPKYNEYLLIFDFLKK